VKNSIRVHTYHYERDDVFAEHLEMLKKYQPALSEIALFVEPSHHGYWPLEGQREWAALLSKRVAAYREAGFPSVGLNVLDTVGHFDEAWDVWEAPPMQTMIGRSGHVSTSCLCPNTEAYRQYIRERYRILAAIDIDFIWIDDDLRLDNHGKAGPCYCSTCIEKFNRSTGRSETFESLSKVDRNDDSALAREWTSFWENCMTEVCQIVHDAIRSVQPDIPIGQMTGPESASVPAWQEALDATKGRPGGGFYYDVSPCDVLFASLRAESQVVMYRKEIVERQYEYESFPYPDYGKSCTMARLESAFALMSDCQGIAYNMLNTAEVSRAACWRTLDMIAAQYAQFSAVVDSAEGTHNRGVFCSDTLGFGRRLLELGLPVSPDRRYASARIITGNDIHSYDDEQLEKLLCGSVLLDATALQDVIDRGFGSYCGVVPGKTYDNGVYEIFTDHPLNGSYRQYRRNPYVNYMEWQIPVPVLEAQTEGVEVLSELITLVGEKLGPCMTLYRNHKGGNVAVMSFIFSDHCRRMQFYGKKVQLLNLFNEIASQGLPVSIDSLHKLVPVYREDQNGHWILMIANMTFDACESFTVRIKGKQAMRIESDGNYNEVGTEKGDGTEIFVDGLAPWDYVFFTGQGGRHHVAYGN